MTSLPRQVLPIPGQSRFAQKKLNFMGVLRSENLKFRTLTSNWIMGAVIALLMIGFAAIMALSVNSSYAELKSSIGQLSQDNELTKLAAEPIKTYVLGMGSMGVDLTNMLVGAVAVVCIGSEYSTRLVQTTLTTVPKRPLTYLAKFLFLSLFGFVLGFVLAAISYGLGSLLLDAEVRTFVPFEMEVLGNWLAVGFYFMFMTWMGLGFGALVRNNAGGIVLVVMVVLILPVIFTLMSLSNWHWVSDSLVYLPQNLGATMTSMGEPSDDMSRVEAGAYFALWGFAIALLGYLRYCYTDSK